MDKVVNFFKALFGKKKQEQVAFVVSEPPVIAEISEVKVTTPTYKKSERAINKIIIHCTASDYAHHDNVETIDKWHKEKGWSGIGYHYVILKDGSVKLGRDIDKVGAHCIGQNADSIGIVLTGYKFFSSAQKVSLKLLVGELCQMYNLTRNDVFPHSKFANKACPNFDIYEVI